MDYKGLKVTVDAVVIKGFLDSGEKIDLLMSRDVFEDWVKKLKDEKL